MRKFWKDGTVAAFKIKNLDTNEYSNSTIVNKNQPYQKITNKKISEKTGISLRTVSTILNRFKKIDILNR